ncbi:MAG: patatin family protein [Clostridiales bacterium]|uniref:patatin-like phospholipase family protein n=1 Tax=Terrisporobacter sp. TaxID=1965305 RepID=UPI002A562FBF|nr:patatin family protein [Terrisporobacter sp.]MDD7754839.1 patatin family protein [Clostridiales bacterium]MDY4136254.1 patatin family protein [Terrisporobacter sp.]
MIEAGLVVEGGGMRGVYTAGVLDYFMEKNLYFDDCYGVSAGACHISSYVSKQIGRSIKVTLDYINDKRYCSVNSLIKTGDMFGVEMLYDLIPNKLELYDYDTFNKFKGNFYSVVTNCKTGKAEYIKIKDMKKDIIAVRASSSLPLLSRIVEINGKEYLDGGITDSIPIKKSIKDGHKKNVVILTRDKTYRKSKPKFLSLLKFKYKKYPNLVKAIENRYKIYNETLDFLEEEKAKNKVFIIQPKLPVKISRIEKDKDKLKELYDQGYEDAKELYEDLMKFLEE